MKHLVLLIALSACASTARAPQAFFVTPVAEKTLSSLPEGPLYWRIQEFPSLAEATDEAGETWLVAEVSGTVWRFMLGPKAAPEDNVVEIGPLPPLAAETYLLRVNHAGGPPGSKTQAHTHPGSEAFYVLSGRLAQRTSHGVAYVEAGETLNGHGADTPMQLFSAGTTDLDQLVMFVVDADRPFSSPATLE